MESTSLFYFSKTWKLLTPEELLEKKGIKRIVTIEADENMLKRLAQTDIPFFAQKNADGYKVMCDERDEERVRSAMKSAPHRKVR